MANIELKEATLVDLWKTKCDSLRAFEPSAFYKEILMSDPIDRPFIRGIKDTDYLFKVIDNEEKEGIATLGLVSLSYSLDLFDEYVNPRVREHFGKISAIVFFEEGTKAYVLPKGEKELVYDYEHEALTFGKFLIKDKGESFKIRSPLEPEGFYMVKLLRATPLEQNMDLAQEVQIEECNRILDKYSNENILQMYQNYIIAKANELEPKYLVVPDEVARVLIIGDDFLENWLCTAYFWTFNTDYFYQLAEYFNMEDFLSDLYHEHKKYPNKIIFIDRYFQRVDVNEALPANVEIIFKNCEIGVLDICDEAKFSIKLKNTVVLNNKRLSESMKKLLVKDAKQLDYELSMDHFNRFFKDDSYGKKEIESAKKYFKKEADKKPWSDRVIYGEAGKILLVIDENTLKDKGAAHITDFYTTPACRGIGLGRKYIEDAKKKYKKLYLDVNKRNRSAIAIYKKFGFKVTDEYKDFDEDFYLMSYNCDIKENTDK